MVGRLVQQQQERRLGSREHAGQSCPQSLAAAERAGKLQRRFVAESKSRQRGMGFVA
jgi:hypothetical protein